MSTKKYSLSANQRSTISLTILFSIILFYFSLIDGVRTCRRDAMRQHGLHRPRLHFFSSATFGTRPKNGSRKGGSDGFRAQIRLPYRLVVVPKRCLIRERGTLGGAPHSTERLQIYAFYFDFTSVLPILFVVKEAQTHVGHLHAKVRISCISDGSLLAAYAFRSFPMTVYLWQRCRKTGHHERCRSSYVGISYGCR